MNRRFTLGAAVLAAFFAAAGCSSKEGVDNAKAAPAGKPAVSVDAANAATGDVTEGIEVTGTLGPMAVLMTPGKSWPLDITAKAAEASLRVNGKIQNPTAFRGLELNFGAQGKEVGNFQALIGKPLPVRGPFDVSGRLTDPAPKNKRALKKA